MSIGCSFYNAAVLLGCSWLSLALILASRRRKNCWEASEASTLTQGLDSEHPPKARNTVVLYVVLYLLRSNAASERLEDSRS